MDAIEAIVTRRSTRKFLEKPVEWDKIVDILNAGKFAPSAGNLQNWKFVVIREDTTISKIADACYNQDWIKNAGAVILIYGEPQTAERFYSVRGERLYTVMNCAAAAQNMLLAARATGLGSCWVSAFDEQKIIDIMNSPEEAVPMAVIVLGYAAEEATAPPRNQLHTIVFLERWGGRRKFATFSWHSENIEKFVKNTKKAIGKQIKHLRKKIEEKSYAK